MHVLVRLGIARAGLHVVTVPTLQSFSQHCIDTANKAPDAAG